MLLSIVTGVISGLCASILFWLVFFKYSLTKIVFSNVLIRQKNVSEDGGPYRYRIRIANIGFANLMDVETITTIRIKSKNGLINGARVLLGNDGHISILRKQPAYPELKINKKEPHVSISTIYLTDSFYKEYKKSFYTQKIQKKATSWELTLDDLWNTYKDKMRIRIFLHGTDEFSGRRIFVMKEYNFSDIKRGKFSRINKQWEQQKKIPWTAFTYKKWLVNALSTVEEEMEQ